MPETAEQSLPDSDPITSSESVLLNNEASQRPQNIPSPLSDTATSVELQQKKEKHQDDVSETPTDPEQLQENLQLPPHVKQLRLLLQRKK